MDPILITSIITFTLAICIVAFIATLVYFQIKNDKYKISNVKQPINATNKDNTQKQQEQPEIKPTTLDINSTNNTKQHTVSSDIQWGNKRQHQSDPGAQKKFTLPEQLKPKENETRVDYIKRCIQHHKAKIECVQVDNSNFFEIRFPDGCNELAENFYNTISEYDKKIGKNGRNGTRIDAKQKLPMIQVNLNNPDAKYKIEGNKNEINQIIDFCNQENINVVDGRTKVIQLGSANTTLEPQARALKPNN